MSFNLLDALEEKYKIRRQKNVIVIKNQASLEERSTSIRGGH
jgi:hypothetical protein